MKLDLRFISRPIEDVWCNTMVVLVFQCPVEKMEVIAGLDMQMAGYLSRLWRKGFWSGSGGETLLVSSNHMFKAHKILIKGLGPADSCTRKVIIKRIGELGETLRRLQIRDFCVRMPVAKGGEKVYPLCVLEACARLVDSFFLYHGGMPDFLLKVNFSIDRAYLPAIELASAPLVKRLDLLLDYTIIFDRSENRP